MRVMLLAAWSADAMSNAYARGRKGVDQLLQDAAQEGVLPLGRRSSSGHRAGTPWDLSRSSKAPWKAPSWSAASWVINPNGRNHMVSRAW